ncbi:hypothetical protein BCR35DRAFT_311237 [Leucosporidium creatinivorum]|uniref:Uncharacterized protein n=1 Tax=Leucosporidium creatinivorum TaxID=106004 RepID=A0A1Y2C9I4_9BASI|nr:hypothetical protein BCR35DRAFT_311237 [Leucosporidium creatinivorum]
MSASAYPSSHANTQPPPPPPLSLAGGPPQQGPSVLQILQMGQERNHAADSIAHHPRIESLVKLAKESEATWLQIGQTAEALGDLDRAVASYESALRHNAYSVVALSQIAAICRSKEEFKKAAEYFGRVVGIAPESGDVWGALGHCYLMIDDLKKAYSSYQQALYYMPNPQEPKLWYGIGILYDRYGSLEHAEEAFSSVIRMDPNFEKANEIFFRLGIIYKQQRKSAQSLECFRYILQNPPRPLTEIDIWFQIGHVYEQQKDFLAAKESYERVLAENPAHAKVLQQLGGLYHRSRAPFYNPEVSVQILTKSLESDANDPFSWYLLGRAYMTTSNFGKAYEAYQQAVYRDGKNPAFWCSIGVLYYNINQFHDALDAYSRAIRIHPYLAEVWFNLGALYESCNDQMTDAIDAYQRTLQLDPSNSIVGTRLREIREHQTSGATLSTPPSPKDISPSSLSWNYATNAGGAPAQLAQAGLGLELSPAMLRGGAASPVNGHRFDGPPSVGGARPRSTDPTYRGVASDDRRRPSGGPHHSPSASMDHSPRSTHRLSGPSQSTLPQIKSMQDQRGSPTIPSSSALGGRASPPSPRSRNEGPPPPGAYPPYPRGGPDGPSEMEWERARANGGGRNSAQGHRRHGSPPGSSHGPRDQPPPHIAPSHPYPPHSAYDRHTPSSSRGPQGYEDRPQGYPTPYGYAPYPVHAPPAFDPAGRRYESSSRDERESSERRGSGGSPKVENGKPPASTSTSTPAPTSTKNGKAKKEETPASPPVGRKESVAPSGASTPVTTGGKRKSDGGAGGSAKKERKTPAAKKDKEEKAPRGKANGAKATAASKAAASATEESGSTNPSSPAPTPAATGPASTLASREVDEDYDEGVDALMGLAASASTSSPRTTAPSAPPAISPAPPAPAQVPEKMEVDGPGAAEEERESSANPRKRSLAEADTAEQGESKKTKGEEEPSVNGKIDSPAPAPKEPTPVVAESAPAPKEATPVVEEVKKVDDKSVEEKEDGEVEDEEGEVKA